MSSRMRVFMAKLFCGRIGWKVRMFMWRLGFDVCRWPNLPVLLNECDLVLDVGAADGCSYDWFRARGYEGPIISFEPSPANYAKLVAHKGYNWSKNDLCLSSKEGVVQFAAQPGGSVHDGISEKGTLKLSTTRLDSMALTGTHIFLKTDTEGHDIEVIEGATGILDRVCYLLVEMPGGAEFCDAVVRLDRLGFEFLTSVGNIYNADATGNQSTDMLFVRKNLVSKD
jgi:FkbM family methyltransferase